MVLLMAQYRKYSVLGYPRSRIPEYCNGMYILYCKNTQKEQSGKDSTDMEVRSRALLSTNLEGNTQLP